MKSVKLFTGVILVLFFFTNLYAEKLAITIYNDNLALVRDERPLKFEKGIKEYRFTDVAAQIDPTSVHFKALSQNQNINLLEQNFEFDLVGTQRLLEKYIDQDIIALTTEGNSFSGKLLSAQSGDVIIQTSDNLVKVIKASTLETIEFPSLPGGLITRPTLVWLLSCDKAGDYDTEISYLTKGINWHAEYVAVIDDKDTELDLSGWVSVENKSGASYENAKLKLVAGDVNIIKPEMPPRTYLAKAAYTDEAASQFEEKSFFEYHLYTLQRPATIKDRQIKQLSLFPPAKARVKKIFTYNGQRDNQKVRVNIELENSKANGLGMPLPEGKIRVYKTDVDMSQEFIGEDLIDHTPKDEKLRVYLGNAFDIVGERVVKDVKKIGRRSRQETVEITLRNHKEEKVTVTVIENLWGDWEFIGQTPRILKKDAYKVEFEVIIPANGETTIDYTVLFK
ncbi:DUF4139 domain-containing protein [candidate division KSB1 bacterium]|nr:DUF4139 domain-containing protein [candidate division KSB1 bacterium]